MDRSGLLINKSIIIKRTVLCLLTALIMGFIFYNSSLDADLSSEDSMSVRAMLNSILRIVKIDFELSENFVRKLAHFVEYFVLGSLMYFTARSFDLRRRVCAFLVPLSGFLIASIDETIQLFSIGRSGQFTDVLLDFIGVIIAVFILSVLSNILTKKDKEVLN